MTTEAPSGIRGDRLLTAMFICSVLTALALAAFFVLLLLVTQPRWN